MRIGTDCLAVGWNVERLPVTGDLLLGHEEVLLVASRASSLC